MSVTGVPTGIEVDELDHTPPTGPGAHRRRIMMLACIVFALAAGLRLYDVSHTFVGLLPVREFRSAIIARDLYLSVHPAAGWEREVTRISRGREWSLEPPVLETLAALAYTVTGGERLWLPRLFSTLFYLASGVLLWRIARRFFSDETALFLTTYYLFVPTGVIASKSFQPDCLMMMLFLANLLSTLRWDEEPTRPRMLAMVGSAALAVLVRPICIFPIVGGFTALTAFRFLRGDARPLAHLLLFPLGIALASAYYVWGLLFSDRLAGQADMTFLPHLLATPHFWRDWVHAVTSTATWVGVVIGLLGLLLVKGARLGWLLLGLGGSYVAFGLIFDYHISTHYYYTLQLVPSVALAGGSAIAFLIDRTRRMRGGPVRVAALHGLAAALVLLAARQVVHHGRTANDFESPEVAAAVGDLVGHSTSVVYLARYYGRPLEYFGRLSGAYWPRPTMAGAYDPDGPRDVSVEDRLAALAFTPEYFVITDLREARRHHADLQEYLVRICEPLSGDARYYVYGRCR
jgi:4-amino-4-deoxy-L-arabinose transferase-like glycosyltransferase